MERDYRAAFGKSLNKLFGHLTFRKKGRKQKAREEQGINGFGSSESIAQLTTCKTKWLISKNDGALDCWMHMKALEVTKMYNTEVYRKEL